MFSYALWYITKQHAAHLLDRDRASASHVRDLEAARVAIVAAKDAEIQRTLEELANARKERDRLLKLLAPGGGTS